MDKMAENLQTEVASLFYWMKHILIWLKLYCLLIFTLLKISKFPDNDGAIVWTIDNPVNRRTHASQRPIDPTEMWLLF